MTGEKYVQTSRSLQENCTYSQMNNIPSHCQGWQGTNRKVKLERPDHPSGDVLAAWRVEPSWGYGESCACKIEIDPFFKSDFLE